MPILLSGCIKEEHRLRVFENRVLRRIFGTRSFITCTLRLRVAKSRRRRWAGHVARIGAKRNAYRILAGKPKGKKLLGKPGRRWVDNIKIILEREVGWGGMDWINVAEDSDHWRAFVTMIMKLRVS
jgi:hypothetical protein